MEHPDIIEEKPNKKRDIIQITFLFLLIVAIAVLIGAIATIINYADMLQNPLGYNLAHFNIPSCSYFNDKGEMVVINAINQTN